MHKCDSSSFTMASLFLRSVAVAVVFAAASTHGLPKNYASIARDQVAEPFFNFVFYNAFSFDPRTTASAWRTTAT